LLHDYAKGGVFEAE